MELLPGDLKKFLNECFEGHAHLTWLLAIRICLDVSRALSYLHKLDRPIVHNDIKPDNIMVCNISHISVIGNSNNKVFAFTDT
jgi:serine/threonine protein kinase